MGFVVLLENVIPVDRWNLLASWRLYMMMENVIKFAFNKFYIQQSTVAQGALYLYLQLFGWYNTYLYYYLIINMLDYYE